MIDWRGSAYSSDDWYARITGGRLTVANLPEAKNDPLAFKIEPVQKQGEIDLAGARHVLAVEDGYLVGFDAGEFGGGAWWFSKDGTRRRKLTLRTSESLADFFPENVHGFALLGKDVLAFEGLTHLTMNDGRVVRFRRGSDGEWHASLFAQLSACPHAVLREDESTWLFATTAGVFRIDGQARVHPVWQPRGGHLYYPNSLVRDRVGVVYMGMRAFIIRMILERPDTYVVDVLVPPKQRRTGTGR